MNRLFLIAATIIFLGCEGNINVSPIPDVPVNVEVNLNDIDNVVLKQIGGFIYTSGGVRGIIVYRKSQNEYKAYDRNCTYQPADACAVVSFHSSGFYLEDTCCGSVYDTDGFPTGGPAEFPLKEYRVSQANDVLFITN